jgi:hypothetical protein
MVAKYKKEVNSTKWQKQFLGELEEKKSVA